MSIQAMVGAAQAESPALHLVDEIHHRVVNAYAEAVASLSLAAAATPLSPARLALAGAAQRLRAHAETHRSLLRPEGLGLLNVGDYLGRLCAAFVEAALGQAGVELRLETDEVWLDADRCWRVGLIVSELVRNAARHGLRGRGGEIVVRLTATSGGLVCLVADNGGAAGDVSSGRGLRLVRALAADLQGFVDWRFTPHGSVARLQAPLGDPS